MANTYEYQAYTLIGMADKFQDFFNGTPKNVTFEYKELDGNLKTKVVPNISLLKQQLNDYGITSDDLTTMLDGFGKIGDNLVFGFGAPDTTVFDGNDNVVYVDKNTSTIYTKNDGGAIVTNFNASELNDLLLEYMKIDRDIVFGSGAPDLNIADSVKLYVDGSSNTLYMRNNEGSLETVSSVSQTDIPVVSGPSSILETNTATYSIDNFDASKYTTYNIVVSAGSFTRVDGNITYTPVNANGDQNITIEITATDTNLLASNKLTLQLTVTNVLDEADQVLVNNNYSGNEAGNDGWAY